MRIFIADDHPIVAQAIKSILETADPVLSVSVYLDLSSLMAGLDDGSFPDFALVDYCMPSSHDGSAIVKIRERYPDLRLGVISGQEDIETVRKAMAAGALGFVPKSMAPEAMVHAIRIMAAGGHYLPWPVMMRANEPSPVEPPAVDGKPAKTQSPHAQLTDREREVLQELVQGLTNKEIGANLGIAEVTVKLHLRRLYKKIHVSNRAGAVRFAMENRS